MQTEFTRNICESSGLCSIAGSKKDSTSGEVREEGSRRKIRRLKRKVEEERQGTRSVRFWRQCNQRKRAAVEEYNISRLIRQRFTGPKISAESFGKQSRDTREQGEGSQLGHRITTHFGGGGKMECQKSYQRGRGHVPAKLGAVDVRT